MARPAKPYFRKQTQSWYCSFSGKQFSLGKDKQLAFQKFHVGFRVIAYGARHSWATEALMNGGVDPISVAHLMGHRDTTMVARVYSHLAKNPDFLRQQAMKAVGETEEECC